MRVTRARIGNILTRTTGYLETVCSHSMQPYRGCSLGFSLCGVGCYVRHNHYLTRGEEWGGFLEARENAGESYLLNCRRERRWAERSRGAFSVFLSSSTEPFLPQESRLGITGALLDAMIEVPADVLIVQTHSHLVLEHSERLEALRERCGLRVHISIETDREEIPGLPPPFSSIDSRFEAARCLRDAGIEVVVGVLEDACRALNEVYAVNLRSPRPFVTLKAAMTADGRLATRTGKSKWITGDVAREHVHLERAARA